MGGGSVRFGSVRPEGREQSSLTWAKTQPFPPSLHPAMLCSGRYCADFYYAFIHIFYFFAVIGFACPVRWEARSRKIV